MFRRVNSLPVLFAQPLEIKDGQRLWRFKSIDEQIRNLLCDRSVLPLRAGLKLLVESVGKILDIQNRHNYTPFLLHYGGMQVCDQELWCLGVVPRLLTDAGETSYVIFSPLLIAACSTVELPGNRMLATVAPLALALGTWGT